MVSGVYGALTNAVSLSHSFRSLASSLEKKPYLGAPSGAWSDLSTSRWVGASVNKPMLM